MEKKEGVDNEVRCVYLPDEPLQSHRACENWRAINLLPVSLSLMNRTTK